LEPEERQQQLMLEFEQLQQRVVAAEQGRILLLTERWAQLDQQFKPNNAQPCPADVTRAEDGAGAPL
jgi:hypothetical protein